MSERSLVAVATLVLGLGVGIVLGTGLPAWTSRESRMLTLPNSYELPVRYGELGPRLLELGAVDLERLSGHLRSAGVPLTATQRRLLLEGGKESIEINQRNALFLLDFFWALGLVNRNPILSQGPMTRYGTDQIGRFASTGGWSLGTRPGEELYATALLLELTPAQEQRLAWVSQAVYRPCCENPALFPDCNHGMAMLGMLSLLAAHDASEAEMFEAAAVANAAWYPQYYQEIALYLNAIEDVRVGDVNPRGLVAPSVASGSGFHWVHRALIREGLAEAIGSGNAAAC